eukprot:gnl/MRDRNA2_/MRDRNA2_24207_c0_seq1.p1 gnl/MRDRNA2_/MRDRNA2_24207_c0~~gnl/MRDRNA2_/MRDRNA2_24207_c0_seq1.p1  ORF type:complete len:364 (+),score=74.27 gnl/MRDRNA2_/MRDRNA2_24207_c0_seq1:68-1093(+)
MSVEPMTSEAQQAMKAMSLGAPETINWQGCHKEMFSQFCKVLKDCTANADPHDGSDPSLAPVILLCAFFIWNGHSLEMEEFPLKTRDLSKLEQKLQYNVKTSLKSFNGPWNSNGLYLLKELGFDPKFIVDIGANVGDWTRKYKLVFPRARFMLVDGSDHKADWRDLLFTGSVDCAISVLDECVHEVQWYGTGSTGDSIRKEQTGWYDHVDGVPKQSETLDGLLQEKGWDALKVELVKLDVQGSELDVMRGASKVLSQAQVVVLEVPVAGSYNAGAPGFYEYLSFMDQAGFSPWDVPEYHRLAPGPDGFGKGYLIQMDIIFLRKSSPYWNEVQKVIEGSGRT